MIFKKFEIEIKSLIRIKCVTSFKCTS